MKKFEYYTYTYEAKTGLLSYDIDFNTISDQINFLGAEGWELVSVVPQLISGYSKGYIYTFKREIL